MYHVSHTGFENVRFLNNFHRRRRKCFCQFMRATTASNVWMIQPTSTGWECLLEWTSCSLDNMKISLYAFLKFTDSFNLMFWFGLEVSHMPRQCRLKHGCLALCLESLVIEHRMEKVWEPAVHSRSWAYNMHCHCCRFLWNCQMYRSRNFPYNLDKIHMVCAFS